MTKRYFVWRDESGDVHCDVLTIPSTPGIGLEISIKNATLYLPSDFEFGKITLATINLGVSILCDYLDIDIPMLGETKLQKIFTDAYKDYGDEFSETFLGIHRLSCQNFYIEEVEIRLFIERCDKEKV